MPSDYNLEKEDALSQYSPSFLIFKISPILSAYFEYSNDDMGLPDCAHWVHIFLKVDSQGPPLYMWQYISHLPHRLI